MSVAFDSDVTIQLEMAFGYAPYATPVWTDVSAYMRDFTFDRGRSHELDSPRAGFMKVTLDNLDGRFDPTYTSGAYYPNVKVMTPIRLRAIHSVTTYDLFRGFVEGWPQEYPASGFDSVVRIRAVDGFKLLGNINTATEEAEESSEVRIGNHLDDAAWPSGWRDLNVGDVTVAKYKPNCQSVLSLCKYVERTEGGLFFMAANGDATFQEQTFRSGLSSIGTFGDDIAGGEIPYNRLRLPFDDHQIWNRVEVRRHSGDGWSSESASSITDYGKRTLKFQDTLHTSETAVSTYAAAMATRYKDPHVRVDQFEILPQRSPALAWPVVLGAELSDKLVIKRRPAAGNTISLTCYIEAIRMKADAQSKKWEVSLQLSQYT